MEKRKLPIGTGILYIHYVQVFDITLHKYSQFFRSVASPILNDRSAIIKSVEVFA
jgi:hypothetical protein